MVLSRFPTYLRVVGSPVFERHAAAGPAAATPARTLLPADQLYGRLEAMGLLAPGASLSFVAVHLDGKDHLRESGTPGAWRQALAGTARRVLDLTRATDAAGWLRPDTVGVALQGAGPTAAAAVAARMAHHLNAPGVLPRALTAVVTAASGTGANWDTLAEAVMASVEDACC